MAVNNSIPIAQMHFIEVLLLLLLLHFLVIGGIFKIPLLNIKEAHLSMVRLHLTTILHLEGSQLNVVELTILHHHIMVLLVLPPHLMGFHLSEVNHHRVQGTVMITMLHHPVTLPHDLPVTTHM